MATIINNQYGYFQKRNGNILLVAETDYGNILRKLRPFRTIFGLTTFKQRVLIILLNRLECLFISDALNEIFDSAKHRNYFMHCLTSSR